MFQLHINWKNTCAFCPFQTVLHEIVGDECRLLKGKASTLHKSNQNECRVREDNKLPMQRVQLGSKAFPIKLNDIE